MAEDASPVLAEVLEPGEVVTAAGSARQVPPLWTVAFGLLGGLFVRRYWVTLTDRRLILIRFHSVAETPLVDREVPRAGLRVDPYISNRVFAEFTIRGIGWKARLRFYPVSKAAGEAIRSALSGFPET